MIASSLELNSDDFPFFGDLKRTSRSREKLEKSSLEKRDNHHRPRASESRRWWWWLDKIRKTKIQKKDEIHKDTKTNTHTQIQKNTKYTITKDQNAKIQMFRFCLPSFWGQKLPSLSEYILASGGPFWGLKKRKFIRIYLPRIWASQIQSISEGLVARWL